MVSGGDDDEVTRECGHYGTRDGTRFGTRDGSMGRYTVRVRENSYERDERDVNRREREGK